MNMSKYRALIKVVELGSLTKAANQLGYSQPGISHMIDSLETEMGFALLNRNKDKILPTEDGKKILYYCYQIIKSQDYLKDTVASIHGLMTGHIHIGSYCSMLTGFVPAVIYNYSQVYANIGFSLREVECAAFHNLLTQGTIDLAFMNEQVPKGFTFIPLFHDAAYIIMRKDHPLASYDKISPSQLNGCNFVMPQTGFDDIVNSVLRTSPFSPNIKCYVASDIGAISLVAIGAGVSVISSLQTSLLPASIVARPFTQAFGRDLGLTVKSLKHTSPAIKEFVRISKETAAQMNLVFSKE
jgi:DNA-binding transcriptional LysR family regulator